MKKHFFNPVLSLMLGLILFTSCQEDEIDSVFFRTDGGLSTVLKDSEGQVVSDAKVSLYNMRTENRIDVAYTDENGKVDFGRFEAGEYSISYEFHHNDEFFQINEEVHIISGSDKQHEVNIADHYGEILIRVVDNNTGELIEFDADLTVGLIPIDDSFLDFSSSEKIMSLIKYSFDWTEGLSISDLPEATYFVVLHTDNEIINTYSSTIDPFEKKYVSFSVNQLSLLLASKSTWNVSNVTAEANANNIMPISSITFNGVQEMVITYENGETDDAYTNLYSNGRFDWYNLGTSTYNFYYDENTYVINSDGSITFNFNYWETYNYNEGTGYYSNNVSVTLI